MENINSQLIEIIFTISRLMKGQITSHGKLAKLSLLQVYVLLFLAKTKHPQMSDIAENFSIELPSATSLVQKLVKDGLVKRSKDKKDRRVVIISLTTDGKKLLQNAMKIRKKKIENHLSLLSGDEKKQLLTILKKMIIKMEEEK